MDNELEALKARVALLEDLEAIKRLKATYCLYCNGGWPQQGGTHAGPIADLFTEDGVWDARPGLPVANGREEIRKLFVQLQAIEFSMHPVTNPIIDITGDTATGHWHLIGIGTLPGGISGFFLGGYEEDYRRTATGWKFKSMRVFYARQAALPGGWVLQPAGSIAPEVAF